MGQGLHLEMKSTAEAEVGDRRNDPIEIEQLNSKKDQPQFLAQGFQKDGLANSAPSRSSSAFPHHLLQAIFSTGDRGTEGRLGHQGLTLPALPGRWLSLINV